MWLPWTLTIWGVIASIPLVRADIQFREPNSGLTFNMSAVNQSSSLDLHINISVPSSNGWGAIGVGSQMAGALMFILLPDSQNGSTISVRTASGNSMPTAVSDVAFEMVTASSQGNTLQAYGTCSNCASWNGQTLSASTTSQPFIWAVGPGSSGVQGTGNSATIEQHSNYGAFSVDMTEAAQAGTFQSSTLSLPNNDLVVLHAILLGGAFGIAMPLAVIFLRIARLGFKPHWMLQSLALAASVVGLAVAIYMSATSTAFSNFSYGHQIIGIMVVVLLIPQAVLGRAHHVNFKKLQRRSVVSYFHLWIGRGIIPLGMLNGVLGFLLTQDSGKAAGAGVVAAIIYAATFAFAWYSKRQKPRGRDTDVTSEWYPLAGNAASREQGFDNANAPTSTYNMQSQNGSRTQYVGQEYDITDDRPYTMESNGWRPQPRAMGYGYSDRDP